MNEFVRYEVQQTVIKDLPHDDPRWMSYPAPFRTEDEAVAEYRVQADRYKSEPSIAVRAVKVTTEVLES